MLEPAIVDDRVCTLGEGVLWHPEREQLFWFDIIAKKLLSQGAEKAALEWRFDQHVSAAGWIDRNQLLIASETALFTFDLESGQRQSVCALEADTPITRSNDGRADPWGGFWIGTMGKKAETAAGAIYRYYRGELRQLYAPITIANSICFSPDRRHAYFSDTVKALIWRQALAEKDGWPRGDPEIFIDCNREGVFPDGAVVDTAGNLWNAQWGAARVACYDSSGKRQSAVAFPAEQVSCPAFGGRDMKTLFATSATQDLAPEALSRQPHAGKTFGIEADVTGQQEHRVILG